MSRLLADTTVLIDIMRGRPAARRLLSRLDQGDELFTSAVNVEELWRGLRPSEIEAAHVLVAGLVVAPVGATDAMTAGLWRASYASRGVTLSQADALIAAVAKNLGATLLTGNSKHFPMREVRREHWQVGE